MTRRRDRFSSVVSGYRLPSVTSSRVLFRTLIGLNVVLFVGYFGQLILAVQTGSNPWAGMAIPWLVGLALVVFFMLVPAAAIGIAAPFALFDLAAGWYLLMGRSPVGIALAVCAVLAFAVSVTLQGIAVLDWLKRRRRGGMVSGDQS
jgi:hypothetical protein